MNIPKYSELFRKELLLKNYAKSSIENYVSQVVKFMSDMNSFTEPSKVNESEIKSWLMKSLSVMVPSAILPIFRSCLQPISK